MQSLPPEAGVTYSNDQFCLKCRACKAPPKSANEPDLRYTDARRKDATWMQHPRLAPLVFPAMAQIPGWHYSMYHDDRLHNEMLGICRDWGGALIRDLVELLDVPFEEIFAELLDYCREHKMVLGLVGLSWLDLSVEHPTLDRPVLRRWRFLFVSCTCSVTAWVGWNVKFMIFMSAYFKSRTSATLYRTRFSKSLGSVLEVI